MQNLETGEEELFHIASDPADSRNVLEANPVVADRLGLALDEWVKNLQENIEAEKTKLDEEMIDKLKGLGHIK